MLSPQFLGALVAQHRRTQPDLARLEPLLPLTHDRGPADEITHDRGQDDAEHRRENTADKRGIIGVGHFGEAFFAQSGLVLIHDRKLIADRIHFSFSSVGRDDRESGFGALRPAQIDGLLQLGKLGIDMKLERREPGLLL